MSNVVWPLFNPILQTRATFGIASESGGTGSPSPMTGAWRPDAPRFVPAGYMPARDAVVRWADLRDMPVPPQRPEGIIRLPADSRSELRQCWRSVSRALQQELYGGVLRAFEL